jgi:hypothetical protein
VPGFFGGGAFGGGAFGAGVAGLTLLTGALNAPF